jgi:hypothetical protein
MWWQLCVSVLLLLVLLIVAVIVSALVTATLPFECRRSRVVLRRNALDEGDHDECDDYSFDVDMVITWVNPSDPLWIDRLNAVRRLTVATKIRNSARFNNASAPDAELALCIESALLYAPWIRRVHIVTDRQVPACCARGGGAFAPLVETGRICIVDHAQLWPPDRRGELPVFNSCAIESRIHAVPGLAQRFLYSNDDCFMCLPLHKPAFFTPAGVPLVRGRKWTWLHSLGRPFSRCAHGADSARRWDRRSNSPRFNPVTS